MRKLSAPRGGGEKVGVLSIEVAALMSRAAGLWRALDGASLSRLRVESIRLEGVRRLVSDDDAALLSLALAEMAVACRDLARAVSRLSARCNDPLLRRFHALFADLVKRGAGGGLGGGDPNGLRYAAEKKMDRKARKMQRLVANTAHLCHELDVLAELDQQHKQLQAHHVPPRTKGVISGGAATLARSSSSSSSRAESARRVARQRQEVERLRAASLWARTFDYAVRLLARSLFTIVARIIEVFDLEPVALLLSAAADDDEASSGGSRASRLSWSTSFVSGGLQLQSMVYPSDAADDAPARKMMLLRARSGKVSTTTGAGDARRRLLMSRSKSLKQQLRWPGAAAGKHLIGCVVMGTTTRKSSPASRDGWIHAADASDLPLSFSFVSAADDFSGSGGGIISFHSQSAASAGEGDGDARWRSWTTTRTTSVFDASSRDVVTHPPKSSLGGAALALHYANLIMFIEKLAASPLHICPDERDALYGMLTDGLRASLRARLRPPAVAAVDPVLAAEWSDTVWRILAWLAPLAHNMVRWQSERNFEHRNCAASSVGDGGATVLLLQTLHFADQRKTEAAVTELLVGLNYMWRHATELEEAKAVRSESESAAAGRRQLR